MKDYKISYQSGHFLQVEEVNCQESVHLFTIPVQILTNYSEQESEVRSIYRYIESIALLLNCVH